MIIGISGKAQSGKDTVGSMIAYLKRANDPTFQDYKSVSYVSKERCYNWLWKHVYFALPLKECLCSILNCTIEDLNDQHFKTILLPWLNNWSVRDLLQKFGTGIRQTVDKDFWVKSLFKDYNPDFENWIITDVRFKSEAKAIKDKGGILIRVNKPSAGAGSHISEIDLDDYDGFDLIIENTGSLEDLYNKVSSYVSGSRS